MNVLIRAYLNNWFSTESMQWRRLNWFALFFFFIYLLGLKTDEIIDVQILKSDFKKKKKKMFFEMIWIASNINKSIIFLFKQTFLLFWYFYLFLSMSPEEFVPQVKPKGGFDTNIIIPSNPFSLFNWILFWTSIDNRPDLYS